MPKFEEQPASANRERFDKNEENSENIKKQLHEAMASGDADKIIELGGQMKNLKAQKEEFKGQDEGEAYEQNAKIKDHEDANEMNKQFDETKVAEEAAKEKARIAEETRIQAESEAAQLAAVRAKINGGGSETPAENAGLETIETKETEKQSIENEPLSPIMQKYKKNIEDIILQTKEMKAKAEELRKNGDNKEAAMLDIEANKKSAEIFQGGGETYDDSFIENAHKNQKAGETYSEFEAKRSAPIEEYRKALNDSAQMILKIANETGRLNWQNMSGRLLRDKKFIEAISKTEGAKNDQYFQVAQRDNLFERYATDSDIRYR